MFWTLFNFSDAGGEGWRLPASLPWSHDQVYLCTRAGPPGAARPGAVEEGHGRFGRQDALRPPQSGLNPKHRSAAAAAQQTRRLRQPTPSAAARGAAAACVSVRSRGRLCGAVGEGAAEDLSMRVYPSGLGAPPSILRSEEGAKADLSDASPGVEGTQIGMAALPVHVLSSTMRADAILMANRLCLRNMKGRLCVHTWAEYIID
jgi:hypothetical protein